MFWPLGLKGRALWPELADKMAVSEHSNWSRPSNYELQDTGGAPIKVQKTATEDADN